MAQNSLFGSFIRSQLASIVATGVDYTVTLVLVELFVVWYLAGNAAGAACGALTHFLAGRYWAFNSRQRHIASQSIRYAVVAAGSFILNIMLVFLFTEFLKLHYIFSKTIAAVIVGVGFNFTLHRWFVFR